MFDPPLAVPPPPGVQPLSVRFVRNRCLRGQDYGNASDPRAASVQISQPALASNFVVDRPKRRRKVAGDPGLVMSFLSWVDLPPVFFLGFC